MDKISIVIPTFNRKKSLRVLIQSLLTQKQFIEEIIIVDDGSKDGTYEEIESLSEPLLNIFRIKNSERGFARNFGSKRAKGLYINFFDSDDYAYPNHCQSALDIAKKNNQPPWIITNYEIKNIETNKIVKCNAPTNPILKSLENGNPLSPNSIFIRNDIASLFRFNENRDLSGSEDYELWLRIALKYEPVISDITTAVLINHPGRSVANISPQKALRQILPFIDLVNKNSSFDNFPKIKCNIIAGLYCYLSLQLSYSSCHRKKTIYFCLKAIKTSLNLSSLKKIIVCIRNIIYSLRPI